jgi:UDP-N-acetylmuramate dehydrogenase
MPLEIQRDVPLAPYTTLQLGGAAKYFAEIASAVDLGEALRWARSARTRWVVLGGGSNVIVPDEGVDGLVLHITSRGIRREAAHRDLASVIYEVQAGEPWDAFVHETVRDEMHGVECLSGIPGTVGAAPVQNIGAYGQEVSHTLRSVRAYHSPTSQEQIFAGESCGFGYRMSRFKKERPWVILSVTFELRRHRHDHHYTYSYADLSRALAGERCPSPSHVRDTVLELRGRKSMLLQAHDENRRSVGSFFLNPVVALSELHSIERASGDTVPHHTTPDGRCKLSAAWLIERAGYSRGHREGAVGISSRHALALVHHGGGSTRELMGLAHAIQARVQDVFGVMLVMEPATLELSGA